MDHGHHLDQIVPRPPVGEDVVVFAASLVARLREVTLGNDDLRASVLDRTRVQPAVRTGDDTASLEVQSALGPAAIADRDEQLVEVRSRDADRMEDRPPSGGSG